MSSSSEGVDDDDGGVFQLCVIAECGEHQDGDSWGSGPNDGSGDAHPDFPEDSDVDFKDVRMSRRSLCTREEQRKRLNATNRRRVFPPERAAGVFHGSSPCCEDSFVHLSIDSPS